MKLIFDQFESLDTILDMEVDNNIRRDEDGNDLSDQADNSDTALLWEERTMESIRKKSKRRRGRKKGRGKGRRGRKEDFSDNGSDELSTSLPSSVTGAFTEHVTKVINQTFNCQLAVLLLL